MYNPSNPIRTYKPSGKWNPIIFLISVIGVVTGAIAGAAYQFLVNYNPFVYVNVLASIGAAILVGTSSYVVIKSSQCRNTLLAAILSVLFGASAVLTSHYVSYRHLLNVYYNTANEKLYDTASGKYLSNEIRNSLVQATAPGFKEILKFKIENGWTLRKARAGANEIIINAELVPAIWLIEAAIFIVITFLIACGSARLPYCEKCDCWADHLVNIAEYSIGNNDEPVHQIKMAVNLGELFKKPVENGSLAQTYSKNHMLKYELNVCPSCQKLAFLNIKEETEVLNDRGQKKTKSTKITDHVLLKDDNIDEFLKIHNPKFLTGSSKSQVSPN